MICTTFVQPIFRIWSFFMSLTKHENGYYYVREQVEQKKIHFSLKTKDKKIAGILYQSYLFNRYQTQIQSISALQTKPLNNFPDLEMMIQKIEDLLHEKSFKDETDNKKTNSPIKQTFLKYLELSEMKRHSKSTINIKKKTLDLMIQNNISHFYDFNQEKLNLFFGYLKEEYKDNSIRKIIAEMKAFLNYAIKKSLFPRESYEQLEFPSIKTVCRDTIISELDYEKMIQILEEKEEKDFSEYLQFLWYTGCRPGEALEIKVSDINIEDRSIVVFQNKTQSRKLVIIPRDKVPDVHKISNQSEDGFLFKGHSQGKEYYSKKFAKFKRRYGFNLEYNLYTFRHSFGTKLLNKTGDLELVSKALGHMDVNITAKHYINRNFQERKDKIDEMF